jgi:zinc protease
MTNRLIQPTLHPIKEIDFVNPQIFDITSDVKLFFIQDVANETTRFDLYFDAGNIKADLGIPSFVNALLLSGTKDKTASQINNQIDSLGGFFESGVSAESAVLSMYCLRENALSLLHILEDAIENVAFHEKDVLELIADKKQAFLSNMEKVSFLAQRNFQQRLFHSDDNYSRVSDIDFYKEPNIQTYKRFHATNYKQGLTKVVVVGNLNQDSIDEIIDTVGKWAKDQKPSCAKYIQNLKGQIHLEKDGAIQSAIRVGKTLFNKNHEDFQDFIIVNTILGDYFGSRLMANIREDKGYTYGIGSMLAEFKNIGYFMIATEVGSEVREATINEIKYEILRLQNELVSEVELELVKNYLLGQLLNNADGPYSMMDLFISAELNGKDLSFYNDSIEAIYNITPQRIQELAVKYLNWEDFTIVSAG